MYYYVYKTNMIFKDDDIEEPMFICAKDDKEALKFCEYFPQLKLGSKRSKLDNSTNDITQGEKEALQELINANKVIFNDKILKSE